MPRPGKRLDAALEHNAFENGFKISSNYLLRYYRIDLNTHFKVPIKITFSITFHKFNIFRMTTVLHGAGKVRPPRLQATRASPAGQRPRLLPPGRQEGLQAEAPPAARQAGVRRHQRER